LEAWFSSQRLPVLRKSFMLHWNSRTYRLKNIANYSATIASDALGAGSFFLIRFNNAATSLNTVSTNSFCPN
jgi:hypothetical protein